MSQQREELQIRDLLLKLQVITYGLIEERKRSKEFLTRLREYENSIKQKESENNLLTKANIDLQSKLSLEYSKKTPNKRMSQNIFSDFEERIKKQEEEIKKLSQSLQEKEELFDQQNINHQTLIILKEEEISKLKKELENEKEKLKKFGEDESKNRDDNEGIINKLTKQFHDEKNELFKNIDNLKQKLEEEKKNREEIDRLKKELEEENKNINQIDRLKKELEEEKKNRE